MILDSPLIYTSTCLLLCPEHPDQNGPCPREPHLEGLLYLLPPFYLLVCSKTLSSGSIWPHICLCVCLCLCLFICVWYLLDLIRVSPLPRESQQGRYGLVGQPNHLSLHHRGHWTSCGQSTERSPKRQPGVISTILWFLWFNFFSLWIIAQPSPMDNKKTNFNVCVIFEFLPLPQFPHFFGGSRDSKSC